MQIKTEIEPTSSYFTPEEARAHWVDAVMNEQYGSEAFFRPDLPVIKLRDRNSKISSGTCCPCAISGYIAD